MKYNFFILFFALILISCAKVDPFVLTKRLNPNYQEIKIFWSDSITEVAFNDQIIKKQGVYYLLPKEYKLTWKYQIIKENEVIHKWSSSNINLENTKEIHFEKEQVIKK